MECLLTAYAFEQEVWGFEPRGSPAAVLPYTQGSKDPNRRVLGFIQGFGFKGPRTQTIGFNVLGPKYYNIIALRVYLKIIPMWAGVNRICLWEGFVWGKDS